MSNALKHRTLAIEALRFLRSQDPNLLAQVFKTSAADLLEAQEWIEQRESGGPETINAPLAEQPIAGKFKLVNEARIAQLADMLVNGGAADWADYKRLVGKIAGLRDAFDLYGKIIEDS